MWQTTKVVIYWCNNYECIKFQTVHNAAEPTAWVHSMFSPSKRPLGQRPMPNTTASGFPATSPWLRCFWLSRQEYTEPLRTATSNSSSWCRRAWFHPSGTPLKDLFDSSHRWEALYGTPPAHASAKFYLAALAPPQGLIRGGPVIAWTPNLEIATASFVAAAPMSMCDQ